ncbi:hypothetical protein BKA81DRAFT_46471 [Phyllosticta paracitricarpa]
MRPTSINKLAASPQCPCGRVGTESRNKQVTFLSWGTGRFRPLGDWMEGSMEKFLSSSHLEATTTTTVSRQGCKKKKKKKKRLIPRTSTTKRKHSAHRPHSIHSVNAPSPHHPSFSCSCKRKGSPTSIIHGAHSFNSAPNLVLDTINIIPPPQTQKDLKATPTTPC